MTGELSEAVTAAQSGDEDAFRFLYRSLQPGLLRYLTALVGADAEDVASETWLQISRDLPTFTGGEFRAWTVTIARNRAMDHLRRLRRRPSLPVPVQALTELAGDGDTAERADETISTEAALALIATLPPREAEAVLLRAVIGLDAESAGRVLGRRAGAVRTAAHRGLRRLATLLDRQAVPSPSVDGDATAPLLAPDTSSAPADGGPPAVGAEVVPPLVAGSGVAGSRPHTPSRRRADVKGFRMNPHRPDRRAGRAETERLLDAARIDTAPALPRDVADPGAASVRQSGASPDSGTEPLARLLAAAAGPARPTEMAGEEAALSAFRAARAVPTPAVARRPRRLRLTTGAVAWIGALAATATAGVAFAAAGLEKAPEPPPAPSSAPPTASAHVTTGSVAPSGSTPPGRPSLSGSPPIGASPNGQVHGLCQAWQAKNPEQREKALRTPAFERLVTAAGGIGAVEEYCQRLVPETKPSPSPPSPSPVPSAPARPTPPAEPSPAATPPGQAKIKPSHPADPARD
ncbi:RNA polymerase sigma factor [Micromonospora sp. CA-246542]|uniref:RNA polymerase sigma factor n=1 Tax=Micromonospora sp. CA-246542 TaxID=3239959 RepID=UPI003D9257AF